MKPHNHARPVMQAHPIGSKATTPAPESRQRARNNGGEVSRRRKTAPETPTERWTRQRDQVLARFVAMMTDLYADENDER